MKKDICGADDWGEERKTPPPHVPFGKVETPLLQSFCTDGSILECYLCKLPGPIMRASSQVAPRTIVPSCLLFPCSVCTSSSFPIFCVLCVLGEVRIESVQTSGACLSRFVVLDGDCLNQQGRSLRSLGDIPLCGVMVRIDSNDL